MSEPSKPYDFYELVATFREEGYEAEEAEDLAWKMIQGNPANWPATSKPKPKLKSKSRNDDEIPF